MPNEVSITSKDNSSNEEITVTETTSEERIGQTAEIAEMKLPPCSVPPPPPPPPPLMSTQFTTPIEVPDPKQKLKMFPWNRIKQCKDKSLWNKVKDLKDPVPVNYQEIEKLFYCKESNGRKSATTRIKHLLTREKEMRVDMFLKRCHKTPEELIEMIRNGQTEAFGYDNLKSLRQILPTKEECETLHDISDNEINGLEKVDYFLVKLIKVPDYELQINIMITEGELEILTNIPESIDFIRKACEMLMNNESFHEFLRFVLHVGLFINKEKLAGKAVGFKLTSLHQLIEFKSTDEKTTFLDFAVKEFRKNNADCLTFVNSFAGSLEKTKRCTMEQIQEDFNQMEKKISSLVEKLDNPTCSISEQCSSFKRTAESKLEEVKKEMESMRSFTIEMAEYIGEDADNFSVDELLSGCRDLCEKIKSIQKRFETPTNHFNRGGLRASLPNERRKSVHSEKTAYGKKDKRLDDILEKQRRRSDSIC